MGGSLSSFGKDANGYLMTKPYDWIWQAVNGNRETPSAFNLLVNMPDRRDSFGEDGITDIFLTSGKTSLYTMMGMMNLQQFAKCLVEVQILFLWRCTLWSLDSTNGFSVQVTKIVMVAYSSILQLWAIYSLTRISDAW